MGPGTQYDRYLFQRQRPHSNFKNSKCAIKLKLPFLSSKIAIRSWNWSRHHTFPFKEQSPAPPHHSKPSAQKSLAIILWKAHFFKQRKGLSSFSGFFGLRNNFVRICLRSSSSLQVQISSGLLRKKTKNPSFLWLFKAIV